MKRILLLMLLSLPPAIANAQTVTYSDRYDTTVVGEPVASVEVFYDQLTPYGIWLDDPYLGRVFVTEDQSYVPYTAGYWQYTNVGFVWVSSEPFAWATAHYGRWAYSRPFARWVWRPDTTWGPSWVEWRQEGDYFGWAPLPPDNYNYAPPVESWHYCNASFVLDVNVSRHYEPRTRVVEIHRNARPIEHYTQVNNTRIVVGPSQTVLRQHNVRAVPRQIDARATGRLTAAESAAAVKRAQERRATTEETNRKRLDNNAVLRRKQAEVKPAAKPQIRQERPEQPKPQAQPKPEAQPKPRVEPKPQPRPEPKRVEPKQEPKPEQRQQQPRPEPKRVEPKQQPAPQPKARPEPKPQPEPKRAEPKQEPKPEQRQRPEPKPEPKPEQRQRPEPKPERAEPQRTDRDRKPDQKQPPKRPADDDRKRDKP